MREANNEAKKEKDTKMKTKLEQLREKLQNATIQQLDFTYRYVRHKQAKECQLLFCEIWDELKRRDAAKFKHFVEHDDKNTLMYFYN